MSADRNALDCALVDLAAASTALERSAKPNLKDVEEARDRAKKAHGILDAAHKLMSVGIYTVADAPQAKPEPGPALPFDAPEVVDVFTPTPAELIASWDGWTDEERLEQFNTQLGELSRVYDNANPDEIEPLNATPWMTLYAAEPLKAWKWVLYCIDQTDFEDWDELSVDAWEETLDAPEPAPPTEPEFRQLLEKLETSGLDEGLYCLADWKRYGRAWDAAWKLNPVATMRTLRARLDALPLVWDGPSAEEMEVQL